MRSRRVVLRVVAVAPAVVAAALRPGAAGARDYASAAEVLTELARLEAQVDGTLAALAAVTATARPFAESVGRDHTRHRAERRAIARRLRVPASEPVTVGAPRTLDALRETQQELVHAFAEGLPALDDAEAVHVLARQMVDGARHLAVIDFWIEREEQRAG